ncbi:uncharacterized protein LKV04_001777 [Tautogolabrus adspersus]
MEDADEYSAANFASDNSDNGYKKLIGDGRKLQYSVSALRNNPIRVVTLCLALLCALLLAGIIGQSVHYQKVKQDQQNKLTTLSKDKEDLQDKLKTEQKQKTELETNRHELLTRQYDLEHKANQLRTSNSLLTEETNQLKLSQSQLQASHDGLNKEAEQLNASTGQLQTINHALSKDKELLQKQYDVVLKRKNELRDSYASVTKERDNLQNKINNVSRSKGELQSSYNNLMKDVKHLQERHDFTSKEKDKIAGSHQNLTEEKAFLQNTTDILKKSISELEKAYGPYEKEQRELETTCEIEIQERRKMQEKNNNLTVERDQLRREVERLNATFRETKCNNGWRKHENSCYFTSVVKKSWNSARRHCQSMGADLAVVKSQEKLNFTNSLYESEKEVWIGLTDEGVEGQWTWVDGTPMTTSFWGQGQPNSHNGKNQDCVEFWHRSTRMGEWNDEDCNINQYYICEKVI